MNDFLDIELSKPLEIDGVEVTTLRMREPTVQDQLTADEMKGSDAQKEINTFSNLCEISTNDIKKLTLRDYKKLQDGWLNFTQ